MPMHGDDLEVLPGLLPSGRDVCPGMGRSGDGCEVTFLPGSLLEPAPPGVWHQLPAAPLRWATTFPPVMLRNSSSPSHPGEKPSCSPKGWELDRRCVWRGRIPRKSSMEAVSGSAEDRAEAARRALSAHIYFGFATPPQSPQRGPLEAQTPHSIPPVESGVLECHRSDPRPWEPKAEGGAHHRGLGLIPGISG